MGERRIEFHEYLLKLLGEHGTVAQTNTGWVWTPMSDIGSDDGQPIYIYNQPPESLQINYPCLIYERKNLRKTSADNKTYLKFWAYKLIYITWAPDSSAIDWLADFPWCSFDGNPYEADNLHHYTYTIYY